MHFYPNRKTSPRYLPEDWNSLFIPVLPEKYCTEPALIHLIQTELCIGNVDRVSIVNKKKNNSVESYSIAFIHFDYWFRTEDTNFIRTAIETEMKCDIYGFFDKNNIGHPFTDSNGNPLYIRFVKFIPTIKEPVKTGHVSKTKQMTAEKQILEQRLELNAQASRIKALESQMQQMMSILLQPMIQPSEYVKLNVLNTLPLETPSYLTKYDDDDYILPPLRLEHLLDEEDDYNPKKLSILMPESEENTPWSLPKAPRKSTESFIPEF
jgi:hypothetical protein